MALSVAASMDENPGRPAHEGSGSRRPAVAPPSASIKGKPGLLELRKPRFALDRRASGAGIPNRQWAPRHDVGKTDTRWILFTAPGK